MEAEALMADIERFRSNNGCDRLVMVWCGSTQAYREPGAVHQSIDTFERGLTDSHLEISPSQIYAHAASQSRVPYANGSPSLTCDLPCIRRTRRPQRRTHRRQGLQDRPNADEDHLGPRLQGAMLGMRGWYSTNILGNRDGEVLDDPENFKSKEVSKLEVLSTIFQPEDYPELHGDIDHVVRINDHPPRGDNKEGWDNIDIFGWMGYPMQIKVNFLSRDSILAVRLVLDLALFFHLAALSRARRGEEWLSFYFKSPQTADPAIPPENDLFIQQTKLKNTLREWMVSHQ